MSHESAPKIERIRKLVDPYKNGRIFWPETMVVESLAGKEPYDFMQALETEFTNYNPFATSDDALDAHAYAYALCAPQNWKDESVQNRMRKTELGTYDVTAAPGWDDRGVAQANEAASSMKEYEYDGEIEL